MYLVGFEGQLPIHKCIEQNSESKCQMPVVYVNDIKSRGFFNI